MRLNHAVVLAALGNLFGLAGASVVVARADCKAYKIVSGDTCATIASKRCGNIKLDDLYSYNSGLKAKCNNLKVRVARCAHTCPTRTSRRLTRVPSAWRLCVLQQGDAP